MRAKWWVLRINGEIIFLAETRPEAVVRLGRHVWTDAMFPEGESIVTEILPVSISIPDRARAAGGYARAESLTPEQRTEIASKAAKTRWNK